MLKKILIGTWIGCSLGLSIQAVYAQEGVEIDEGLGQTVLITTHLDHFVGLPTLLLIIRDIDDGINIPYLFDIRQGDNAWVAITYGHDYLITASKLTIVKYEPRYNAYRNFVTNDFCHLQSSGRIHRGTSMSVEVTGDLSPNRNLYNCNVTVYPNSNYTVVEPELD